MFVQVIEGRVADAARLRRQLDDWNTNVRPDAPGFLGSTAGVTHDGHGIIIARFASEQAATANSDRPAQGAWWAATQHAFEGPVSFRNAAEVETMLDYGAACEGAGFVQVIQARVADRGRLVALEDASLEALKATRPSLIGALRGWDGDHFVQPTYFVNEPDARRDEAAAVPDAVAGALSELRDLWDDAHFLDLTDPWLM